MIDANQDGGIDPLTRLAIKYGTDKWGLHFYTPVYHGLFAALRDKPIRLLEIGIGGYELKTAGGASLAMWAEYFPRGQITGIDIAEKRLQTDPRVKLFRGSQDDAAFLKKVSDECGPFDIVIDDGSHVPKQVVSSFQVLFPLLADGGMYVIEDIQTAFWPAFGGSMLHGAETMKLARTVIECINHADLAAVGGAGALPAFAKQIKSFRAVHNLFVIEKGDNREPSSGAYDLANRHAVRAVAMIEQELKEARTAAGMANLCNIYISGKRPAAAKAAAEQAVSLWPDSAVAVMAAYRTAVARKDAVGEVRWLEQLVRIEPDNDVLQNALQQARARTNSPQSQS